VSHVSLDDATMHGARFALLVCLAVGVTPLPDTHTPTNWCQEHTHRLGCFENFERFCQVTSHEAWIDEAEFLAAWQSFAGHDKECAPAFPFIVAELTLATLALVGYLFWVALQACCPARGGEVDVEPELEELEHERPRRASV